MKSLVDCYTLSNGARVPCIGLGTWQTAQGDEARDSVCEAVMCGYRHIDTATAYGNEESVGRGVKKSGVPREEIFITTKLWNADHGYDRTAQAIERSMSMLGGYIDLYLIHWPNPIAFRDNWREANAGSWRAMEEYYRAGHLRAIGLSNFHVHHIEELMKTAAVAPMVNQIRLCPGETQDGLADYCRRRGMILEAYSPFGVGKIFGVPEMEDLAKKYKKSVAQICVRWRLERGYLPLPKSVHPSRIRENADVFGFRLDASDIERIAGMTDCVGHSMDPDTITF